MVLTVRRAGFGHELLTRIVRYAPILDKYSRPQLARFASCWVGKTWLRFSHPDEQYSSTVLPAHEQKSPKQKLELIFVLVRRAVRG